MALVSGSRCHENTSDIGHLLLALTWSPRWGTWRRRLWWLPQLCYDLVLCSTASIVLHLCWLVGGWFLEEGALAAVEPHVTGHNT